MPNFWRDKIVFVSGAGGFIASHLVEALVERQAQVRAFVRYNSRNDPGLLALLPESVLSQVEIKIAVVLQPSVARIGRSHGKRRVLDPIRVPHRIRPRVPGARHHGRHHKQCADRSNQEQHHGHSGQPPSPGILSSHSSHPAPPEVCRNLPPQSHQPLSPNTQCQPPRKGGAPTRDDSIWHYRIRYTTSALICQYLYLSATIAHACACAPGESAGLHYASTVLLPATPPGLLRRYRSSQ